MANLKLSEEQLLLLQKPLPKDAVSPHPTKKDMSSIKAIYVTERLNEVFGVGQWILKTDLIPINGAGDNIQITVRTTSSNKERTEYTCLVKTVLEIPDYGIYYECIAGNTNDDMGDAAKGGTTDAITKICSWLGIGIDVFKGQNNEAQQRWERKIAPVVKAAIKDLLDCQSVQDLTELKEDLPGFVLESNTFKEAALQRFHEITGKKHADLEEKNPETDDKSSEVEKDSQRSQQVPTSQGESKPKRPILDDPDTILEEGKPVDVQATIDQCKNLDHFNNTLEWLRSKDQQGYNIKPWMAAIHEKAVSLKFTFVSKERKYVDYNAKATAA